MTTIGIMAIIQTIGKIIQLFALIVDRQIQRN